MFKSKKRENLAEVIDKMFKTKIRENLAEVETERAAEMLARLLEIEEGMSAVR